MDPEKSEVSTQETKAEAPQSMAERMEKSVGEAWLRAATESAPETTETTEAEQAAETPAAEEVEAKADETKDEVTELPWTAEQMRDPKFYDRLDKAGWELLEKYSPAMAAKAEKVKAVYSALGKVTSPKYQQELQPETRSEAPAEESDAALQAAILQANSLDPKEAALGLKTIIKLTVGEMLPEYGFDPVQAKAAKVASNAYATVVAKTPEIASLDLKELDAVVEGDESLSTLIAVAEGLPDDKRVQITASVMRTAGERLLATKKAEKAAADAQTAAQVAAKQKTQKKVQSNANLSSAAVIEAPASGARTTAKKSIEQFVHDEYAKVVAGNG